MNHFSAKNKIVFLCIAWLMVTFSMFFYFFKLLDNQNQATLDSMSQDRSNLATLQAEDRSFKQAQADLKQLAAETYQPDAFFSRDTNFINELNTMQDLQKKYNVQMQLAGVSGTVNSAPPASTVTPVVLIPYSLSLNGDLSQVVGFIENLENLSFVTTVSGISISAADKGNVNVNLGANFYLRK